MKIILKNAKLLCREGLFDLLIEDRKVVKINSSIDEKDFDFYLDMEERIITPAPIFYYPEPVDPTSTKLLKNTLINGIKRGYPNFIFNIGNTRVLNKYIKEIEELFESSYLKGLFIENTGASIKGDYISVAIREDISNPKEYFTKLYAIPNTLNEEAYASLTIWDVYDQHIPSSLIPYLIISDGKIILREGYTIFI